MNRAHALVLATLALAPAGAAFADGGCDDELSRHHRRDLTPTGLVFVNKEIDGEFHLPNQRVTIFAKNTGENTLGEGATGLRSIKLSINGLAVYGTVMMPVAAGAEARVEVKLDGHPLRACAYVPVAIDTDRKVGQWGCNVFTNDAANERAYQVGVFCRL